MIAPTLLAVLALSSTLINAQVPSQACIADLTNLSNSVQSCNIGIPSLDGKGNYVLSDAELACICSDKNVALLKKVDVDCPSVQGAPKASDGFIYACDNYFALLSGGGSGGSGGKPVVTTTTTTTVAAAQTTTTTTTAANAQTTTTTTTGSDDSASASASAKASHEVSTSTAAAGDSSSGTGSGTGSGAGSGYGSGSASTSGPEKCKPAAVYVASTPAQVYTASASQAKTTSVNNIKYSGASSIVSQVTIAVVFGVAAVLL
ncbi:UNVERIFIED_CONTAM: hypothetical protein HDU68_011949 [Siphonaria sp. JEL0065]|nr:hypothetical protein HDU68_011949 [Siphonaria sp. JEL0065]